MTVVNIKKQNAQKKCVTKRKIKYENYKNCFELTQLENEISYHEKNKISIDNNHKNFIRNNKSLLKA